MQRETLLAHSCVDALLDSHQTPQCNLPMLCAFSSEHIWTSGRLHAMVMAKGLRNQFASTDVIESCTCNRN
eukprot:4945259-Amphidinium_carterae.2